MKNVYVKLFSFSMLYISFISEVMAGPGGSIAKAAVNSFWGRIGLGIAFVVLSPIIAYVLIKEAKAKKRTLQDLAFLKNHSPQFDWLKIKLRIQDCFVRVHSAWEQEDISEAQNWMSSWYWQNQKCTVLDAWKRQGLQNICKVDPKILIKPLLFVHRNENSIAHNGSSLHILISASMVDYLIDIKSGKIVEGCKSKKVVESLWSFVISNGQWVVENIEDSDMSLEYAQLVKSLPAIDQTILDVNLKKVS